MRLRIYLLLLQAKLNRCLSRELYHRKSHLCGTCFNFSQGFRSGDPLTPLILEESTMVYFCSLQNTPSSLLVSRYAPSSFPRAPTSFNPRNPARCLHLRDAFTLTERSVFRCLIFIQDRYVFLPWLLFNLINIIVVQWNPAWSVATM